jgi:pyridoxine 5-phosphate synthase
VTRLSVNLNKIALLRNSRQSGIPSVLGAAQLCIEAGAPGITVHPRPDERHIRKSDVFELKALLADYPDVEFNIEGNPFPEFVELVREIAPAQVTLVPDSPGAVTSDHGWPLRTSAERLAPLLSDLKHTGARISLFMDADSNDWKLARELGADRVELYTEPYANAFGGPDQDATFELYARAAAAAQAEGLGVNAGHDLNLQNLDAFCRIPNILEVSIGHALVSDALELGLKACVRAYLDVLPKA